VGAFCIATSIPAIARRAYRSMPRAGNRTVMRHPTFRIFDNLS
jgi:hypothetical protein